jgi:predicted Rossmann fold nucleotide-binding protein DprA/Smf involved in DNA uptake
VGIVGSREFAPLSLVAEFVASLSADLIIVSGAAKGVDAHAAACARAHNLEVLEIPADWRRGKSAGMQRNAEIVCSSDVIIAFWDGSSAGTAHSVELARRSGIPMFVVRQPAAASAPEQLALF